MNCGALGSTGLDGFLLGVAVIVALGLIAGGTVLLATRRRRGTVAVAALALLVVAILGLESLGSPPASAADCPPSVAENSLTITQTSVLAGLQPGDAPLPISGTVTNNGDDDTFIDSIEVSILSVTLAAGAAPGTCTAADFVLLDPVMPVDAALAPRGTATFAGASLGLVDAPWNQNACQNATVELRYVTG